MKTAMILLSLICSSICFGQHYLQKYQPTISTEDRSRGFFYQESVPLKTAQMLYSYFASHNRLGRIPSFYTLPNSQLFLATASVNSDTGGIGLSFLRVLGDKVREVATSIPVSIECVIPRVAFFHDSDRAIILAEYGDDYIYGFFAAECRHDSARILAVTDMSTESPEGGYGSPTDNVLVRFANGTYILEFTANVIVNPGGTDQVIKLPKSGRLTFYYNGKSFVRSK
jgi:hypothetical protein